MTDGPRPPILLFDTTHHALWAEDVARERAIPAEVVPAPADARARCGLALQVVPHRATDLEEALDSEGIPFRRY